MSAGEQERPPIRLSRSERRNPRKRENARAESRDERLLGGLPGREVARAAPDGWPNLFHRTPFPAGPPRAQHSSRLPPPSGIDPASAEIAARYLTLSPLKYPGRKALSMLPWSQINTHSNAPKFEHSRGGLRLASFRLLSYSMHKIGWLVYWRIECILGNYLQAF